MYKNLKQKQEGFTIIEVMIVLVIAAVILLIVFLAVPALQRNSRNTQRKNDVANVLSGINEWSTNNGGQYPTNGLVLYTAMQNSKTGFYDISQANFSNSVALTVSPTGDVTNASTTEKIQVVTNAKCKDDGSATKSNRTLAILYTVETGGSSQPVCQSS